MSDLSIPTEGLIFGSILFNDKLISEVELRSKLNNYLTDSIEFHHSFFPMANFYSKEMGNVADLKRFLLVSMSLRPRTALTWAKVWADRLEKNFSSLNQTRVLNLDIGFISLENVILATGKNFSHRVYLDHGIFADLTLFFEDKTFKTFPWTYPDYSNPEFINFFNFIRAFILRKINENNT